MKDNTFEFSPHPLTLDECAHIVATVYMVAETNGVDLSDLTAVASLKLEDWQVQGWYGNAISQRVGTTLKIHAYTPRPGAQEVGTSPQRQWPRQWSRTPLRRLFVIDRRSFFWGAFAATILLLALTLLNAQ